MRALRLVAIVFLVAACSSGPILANPPAEHGSPVAPTAAPSLPPDPQPLIFPRDDGPHDRLTEWWYYTGHLVADDGRRFGFEFVVFRAERGAFPVTWASHLAVTDEQGHQFLYDQRSEIGPQADDSPRAPDGTPTGFALAVAANVSVPSGASGPFASSAPSAPSAPAAPSARSGLCIPNLPPATPWTMSGSGGRDHLVAATSSDVTGSGPPGPAFGLDLTLTTNLPPVLHDQVGFINFGGAGGSYYYSRPRMSANGTLQLGCGTFQVTGEAWFDHQWGDFISVGGGGWDWFAVNLSDGSDLTLSLIRDAAGAYPLVYGTLVHPDGSFEHLDASAFSVSVLGSWTSARTGATYPAGWRIGVPGAGLDITLHPVIPDQELDTRPTTGVVYWEGAQVVSASRDGTPLGGEAYVELTGYGATGTPAATP